MHTPLGLGRRRYTSLRTGEEGLRTKKLGGYAAHAYKHCWNDLLLGAHAVRGLRVGHGLAASTRLIKRTVKRRSVVPIDTFIFFLVPLLASTVQRITILPTFCITRGHTRWTEKSN